MACKAIKLITFDALHTLITPRLPIYIQYSQVFAPYLGELSPIEIRRSFKTALKQVQIEKPIYQDGPHGWWSEVIKRTALNAGADPKALNSSLSIIVDQLMHRFSSREGYMLFEDSLPTLLALHKMRIKTGLVSNADSRILSVLSDLGVLHFLEPALISEQEGTEKPERAIFLAACAWSDCLPSETLHVGDEYICDYKGAKDAGLEALWLRRSSADGEGEHIELEEDIRDISVIENLSEVVQWVEKFNQTRSVS